MNSFVPKDWHQASLDEISTFRRGSFPQPYGSPEWFDENGYPFVQVYDVGENNRLKSATKTRISKLAASQSVFVPKGAVVVTIQGSIGRVAITQYDAYFDRTILIFNNISPLVDRDFFAIMVKEVFAIKKEEADGGVIKTITKETLKNFIILLPSLEEQQKIATILTSVDTVIEKTRAQIDKLKHLKTGMMQQLLTQGIGHTEFKDTPVGRIPKAWEIQNINGLVTKVGSGVTPRGGSAAYVSSGVPLIRSQNVYSDGLRLEDVAYITAEQHKKMANSQLKPNDVLLNITGASIGRCHYLPSDFKEGNVNQHVCIIRPKQNGINSAFLAYLLNSELGQRQIMSLQAGGNREGLNFQQIREISFATPTLPEQHKIVNVLQSIDTKIMTASQKLNSVEQTKKALMQDLLTGKVRVIF